MFHVVLWQHFWIVVSLFCWQVSLSYSRIPMILPLWSMGVTLVLKNCASFGFCSPIYLCCCRSTMSGICSCRSQLKRQNILSIFTFSGIFDLWRKIDSHSWEISLSLFEQVSNSTWLWFPMHCLTNNLQVERFYHLSNVDVESPWMGLGSHEAIQRIHGFRQVDRELFQEAAQGNCEV